MSGTAVGPWAMQECPGCDGTWMDRTDFERLCAERAADAPALPPATPRGPARGARRREPIRYRRCPACGRFMNRVNFARHSGIVVDVCREHGLFFDRGELHAVVTFIREGGLDRARAREQDRLEQQRRDLAALERTRAAGRGADLRGERDWNWRPGALTDFLRALLDRA
jgi:Zn-finger nucleic acid-binding protein